MTSGEQLCLTCGLCCDGTLFDNVRLTPGEKAKPFQSLGLPVAVSRTKPPIRHFPQPCAALCTDRSCRIYDQRPEQCRSFECALYEGVQSGRTTSKDALKLIGQTRRRADKVRRLLRRLGDTQEQLSLNEQFRRTQRRLEKGPADAASAELYADLSQAMHRLNWVAHQKFHTKVVAPARP